jgi:hypothetical protein
VSRPVLDVLSPGVAQVIPPCAFRTTKAPGGTIHEAKVAMCGAEPKAVALIDMGELAEALAAVEELVAAGRLLQRAHAFDPDIKERRAMWAEMGQPTDTLPTIGYIRRAATKRFAATLAKFEPTP